MKILGIDEAGRGAVIGPLVVCGFMVDGKGTLNKLKNIGVKDSKELSPKRREELSKLLENLGDIVVIKIPPCKIDASRNTGTNLNVLEAKKMAEIINMMQPDIAYVDAPGINAQRFERTLRGMLENKEVKLVCENFADKKYPVVSAASIIAKIERDKEIEEIKKRVNFDFGVGYPHDERTIKFLEKLVIAKGSDLPEYVRKSWDTTQQLLKKHGQKKLTNFLRKILGKEPKIG